MSLREAVENAKRFLSGRKGAYCRALAPENVDARTVLADLADFCRAHASTAHTDPHVSARLDGRREVWLRIQQHLNLDSEQLWRLFGAKYANLPPTKGDAT